jgi:hypothetical protein
MDVGKRKMKTEFVSRVRSNGKKARQAVGQVCLVDCGSFRCAAYVHEDGSWRNCYTGEKVKVASVLGYVNP